MTTRIHGVLEDWQVERLQAMTPGERVRLGCDLVETGRIISEAGQRYRENAKDTEPVTA